MLGEESRLLSFGKQNRIIHRDLVNGQKGFSISLNLKSSYGGKFFFFFPYININVYLSSQ